MVSELFSCCTNSNIFENINIFLNKLISTYTKINEYEPTVQCIDTKIIEKKEGIEFLPIEDNDINNELKSISKSEYYFCSVCQDNKSSNDGSVTTKCGHKFCIDCYTRYCNSIRRNEDSEQDEINCPLCRKTVTSIPNYGRLVEMLEKERNSDSLTSLQLLKKSDSKTFTIFVFVDNEDSSSRALTPTNDLTNSEERDKIFNDTLNNLATNVQESWRTLRIHRPEEPEE